MSDYPNLSLLTDVDLVNLLACYVRGTQAMRDDDREFIEAIKAELKKRSGKKRLEV